MRGVWWRGLGAFWVGCIGAVALAGALGCASTQQVEPLPDALRIYNEGVRWQRFDDAAARIAPEKKDAFLDERDRLHEDLLIHHYEVIRVRYGPKQAVARVQIKYTWYLNSRGVIHETHTVQTWERRGVLWILASEKWLRGEPMPGMAEPEPGKPGKDKPAPDREPEPGQGSEPEPDQAEPADGGAASAPDIAPGGEP